MIWFVKVVTDPLTDLMAYTPRYLTAYKVFCRRKHVVTEENDPLVFLVTAALLSLERHLLHLYFTCV